MKTGFRTSEFALAAAWWLLTVAGVVLVYCTPWPATFFLAPVVGVIAWMGAAVTNNYAENRWRLKAGKILHQQQGASPKQAFGFGRYVASESQEDEGGEE